MGAQADILAQIAGGLGSSTPKYGDVQKNQLSLDETRAKSNDLKIAEANRVKQAQDMKLLDRSIQQATAQAVQGGPGSVDVVKSARDLYFKGGGGISTWMPYEQGWAKVRQEAAKATQEEVKASGDAAVQLSQGLMAFKALPDDQKAAHAPQLEAELRAKGLLDPAQPFDTYAVDRLIANGVTHANQIAKQQADTAQLTAASEAEKRADEIAKSKALRAADIKEAEAKATTATAAASAAPELQDAAILKARADALKVQQETLGTTPISPEQKVLAAQAAATLAQTAANAAETARHNRTTEGIQAQRANQATTNKPLPQPAIKDLDTRASARDAMNRLATTFKDEYAGNPVTGGLEAWAARLGGESVGLADPGVGQWWQDYQAHLNDVRHGLFGGALTAQEKAQFDLQAVSPKMDPKQIRENLARQDTILNDALTRKAKVYAAGGYNADQIAEYLTPQSAAPATGGTKPPPQKGDIKKWVDGAGKQHSAVFLGGDFKNQKNWKE